MAVSRICLLRKRIEVLKIPSLDEFFLEDDIVFVVHDNSLCILTIFKLEPVAASVSRMEYPGECSLMAGKRDRSRAFPYKRYNACCVNKSPARPTTSPLAQLADPTMRRCEQKMTPRPPHRSCNFSKDQAPNDDIAHVIVQTVWSSYKDTAH